MKSKKKKLIQLLLQTQSATSAVLADALGVSVRTIKTYVHDINDELPGTIHSSYEGYSIDKQKAQQLLLNNVNHIPQNSDERVSYIINQLIHHNSAAALDVYDLCDELYISLSTLKNELNKVKKKLQAFDLTLTTKGDLVACTGLEKNKRKLLSSILYDESNVNFVNLKSIQNAFVDIDISFIRATILEIFDKYHYFINDYSLINLVLHVTIAIDRIRNNNINTQDIRTLPDVRLHEYELATEIAHRFEEHFHITFSDAEIYEMTLLIISRATTIDYKSINLDNLETFVGKDCLDLVQLLISDINAFYYIDLSEPEFLIRFALHIHNLLVRSKNDYFSKNPLTDSMKSSSPLIYDASVNMARIIQEQMGITINDDEIAYIAFHLGSTLEAQRDLTTKITAILYCPNYYDINLRITDMINRHFAQDLLIKYILTDESELDKVKDADLLISTIPLSRPTNLPLITIQLFFTKKDQELLRNELTDLKKKKKKKEFEEYLRELIIPDFFERRNGLRDEVACIHYMVEKMRRKGYVNASFQKDVLEREELSTTAFGSFAIPHAMKMYAKKTGMNILISEEAIHWKEHDVYFVLMLSFNKNDRHIFNEIYDSITMILSDSENLKKILACQDYESFIQTMVALL